MASSLEGLVLAAGLSTRSGSYKMELMFGEFSLLQQCIKSIYVECSRIIVVCGYNSGKVQELVQDFKKVKLVRNDNYEKGMFSSLKTGLMHVSSDKLLITPGDYPLFRQSTVHELALTRGSIVIPVYKSKKGHPIIISKALYPEILMSPDSYNLRDILKNHTLVPVQTDDVGVVSDVDTMDDYYICLDIFKKRADEEKAKEEQHDSPVRKDTLLP
ncbi:MAG TPA: nucleotidyltransferase family protein [Petrotogaceae bacterium]|nr:nucleotidyltransferase family protein [Petrotogaceae bacterium]